MNTVTTEALALLVKPASAHCNLACDYCFYVGKLEDDGVLSGDAGLMMSKRVLATFTKQYLEMSGRDPSIAWQGGEPTLMGLDFFKQAIEYQAKFVGPGQCVGNALQTNGTLIDEDWARYLKENGFLVGLSIDGPALLHDHYRINKGGKGSHENVVRGLKLLQEYEVDFNALIVLNDVTVKKWREVYDYVYSLGVRHFQFIPIVEPGETPGEVLPFSVSPEEYGEYLKGMFDIWFNDGQPSMYVRDFDDFTVGFAGLGHPSCIHRDRCMDYVVVEGNGDVYTCDWTVEPDWKLGNVTRMPMRKMVESGLANKFLNGKANLSDRCRSCKYLNYCQGGCPVHRRVAAADETPQPSYFCEGYYAFFEYAFERMSKLVEFTARRQRIPYAPPPLLEAAPAEKA